MNKLILGTNGFTYSSKRKGENLWNRLVNSELNKTLTFKASGRGWGTMTETYKIEDMPLFYKQLDMYLSTSTIEGAGMGVLEALSCGKPVIIPKNVGIYDELPDIQNIYRYESGNYLDMLNAVQRCISDVQTYNVNPQELRQATEKYTLDNWTNDHIRVFENFLYNTSKSQKNRDSSDLCGIYVVSYGEPSKNCANRLLKSIRKHLGDIPVCIVSDTPLETNLDYIFIEYPDNDIGARGNKTKIYELSPKEWQYVLYLDSDTEITSSDTMFLFDILIDGFDCFFCINPTNYILVQDMNRPDNQDEMTELLDMLGTGDLIQLNGGVFGFSRNDRTKQFFNDWHTQWMKYGKRDQAALDRVLYNNPIRIYTLGVEWNTVTRYYDKSRTAGILHFPLEARRWKGRLPGRLDSDETWAVIHPDKDSK